MNDLIEFLLLPQTAFTVSSLLLLSPLFLFILTDK